MRRSPYTWDNGLNTGLIAGLLIAVLMDAVVVMAFFMLSHK